MPSGGPFEGIGGSAEWQVCWVVVARISWMTIRAIVVVFAVVDPSQKSDANKMQLWWKNSSCKSNVSELQNSLQTSVSRVMFQMVLIYVFTAFVGLMVFWFVVPKRSFGSCSGWLKFLLLLFFWQRFWKLQLPRLLGSPGVIASLRRVVLHEVANFFFRVKKASKISKFGKWRPFERSSAS